MKPWTRIYLKFFDLGEQDVVFCENCHKAGRIDKGGFDLHHIKARSQGGKHNIENIILLCRSCHNAAHAEKIDEPTLKYMHKCFMNKYEHNS